MRVLDTASIVQLANKVRYTTPPLGRVETPGGTFVIRSVRERLLESGAEIDRLVTGVSNRRATPEAALLHWLYLSGSPRSRMSAPPLDLDLGDLPGKHLVAMWSNILDQKKLFSALDKQPTNQGAKLEITALASICT